jgi:uncharacterized protein YgbK (DUF1537 family)
MPDIFVIADDLTSAARIAGIAYSVGLTARIIFDINDLKSVTEDMVIVDSNTRSYSCIDASRKIADIIDHISIDDYALFYKKIDSVLRGRILSEINVLFSKTKFESALLIPANPSKNSVIQDGKYYIDNTLLQETNFCSDPEYPRKVSDVQQLLEDGVNVIVHKWRNEKIVAGSIYIPDIISMQDIIITYNRIKNDNVLLAGGVDFFKVLLSLHLGRQSVLYSSQKQIIVLGSYSRNRVSTLDSLRKKGFKVFQLPENALSKNEYLDKWEKQIFKSLVNETKLVIAAPDKKIDTLGSSQKITAILSTLIGRIYNLLPGRYHFYIEGGETAFSICKQLNVKGLKISEFIDDGVITLKDDNNKHCFTIKPGSYKWPEFIMDNVEKH